MFPFDLRLVTMHGGNIYISFTQLANVNRLHYGSEISTKKCTYTIATALGSSTGILLMKDLTQQLLAVNNNRHFFERCNLTFVGSLNTS